jgi:hypothetical protein
MTYWVENTKRKAAAAEGKATSFKRSIRVLADASFYGVGKDMWTF